MPGHEFIDFSKLKFSLGSENVNKINDVIIIRIRKVMGGSIVHKLPSLNRCCKLANDMSDDLTFSGIDEVPRIPCNIKKKTFLQEYVKKRKPVILVGCQERWAATNWTFKGIFALLVISAI